MIITKTPFRMSFFGGGTDMESFFREYGGAVLSTTFDKYCYVNVRHLPPFFSYATELSYAKTERVNSLEEIEHPAIRNAMKMLDMHHIRLTYEADLPARSGLGTSSSFAVGMLNAFYALKGQYASKEKLAKEAIYLERVLCAEAGGWQDQIAAAFGGFNRIDFSADGYEVRPVLLSPERKRRLNGRLMMFFTGFTRFSAEIQQLNNSRNGADKLARLQEMLALVDEAEAILTDEPGRPERIWPSAGPHLEAEARHRRSSLYRLYRRAVRQRHCRRCAGRKTAGRGRRWISGILRGAGTSGRRAPGHAGAALYPVPL